MNGFWEYSRHLLYSKCDGSKPFQEYALLFKYCAIVCTSVTVPLYVHQFCMFEVLTCQLLMQGVKGGHPHPSNIGDLFSEGSLNPYADDPYAFD